MFRFTAGESSIEWVYCRVSVRIGGEVNQVKLRCRNNLKTCKLSMKVETQVIRKK